MSSRGKEFRERRRRGFDDDEFLPPRRSKYSTRPPPAAAESGAAPAARAATPPVQATVKWFNAEKGFGFVAIETGGDAFLHANVLARAGREELAPGTTLQVRTGSGMKGPQVTEVLAIDDSTATPAAPRARTGAGGPRVPAGPAQRMIGTTKWYDPGKGFGFVSVDGRGQDVFVHASVLQKGGITSLAPGQRVTMDVAEGRRNPEAVSIQLAE
ncbi:MAG TPA: cold-shock protein [Stellaceae bacterium]|nr:cold-shock protein [Stellaceae bacterium]